jgi:hypothetical protein
VILITVGNGFIFVMVKSTKAVRCFKDVCSSSRLLKNVLFVTFLYSENSGAW